MSDSELSSDGAVGRSPESRMRSALQLKEQGNALLTSSVKDAHEAYGKALKELEAVHVHGVDVLRTSIRLNMSLTALKLEMYTESISHASEVLKTQPNNTKCLYRRGQAYLARGEYDYARSDLLLAAQIEPTNVAVRGALAEVRQELLKAREAAKALSTNIFNKGGSFYADREEAFRRRVEEQRIKDEKLKREYEEALESGETEDSFDDWKQARSPPPATTPPPPKASPPRVRPSSDSEEYDEEERKIIAETKRYCYFRKDELTEAERELKKECPMKVGAAEESVGISGSSQWNSAGTTWEERDVTEAAKAELKRLLMAACYTENDMTLSVTAVDTLKGEASTAVVRGTNRFLYDFDEVKVSWLVARGDEKLISGSITVLDLSSCRTEKDCQGLLHCLKVARIKHQKISAEEKAPLKPLVNCLPSLLTQVVAAFEARFISKA